MMDASGTRSRERAALNEAKSLHSQGQPERALAALRGAFGPDSDFSLVVRAAKWTASAEWPGERVVRIAFLGGGVLDHLVDLVAFWLRLRGIRLEPYLSLFDAWRMDVLKAGGPLQAFGPEMVWFFGTGRDVRLPPGQSGGDAAAALADEQERMWDAVRAAVLPPPAIVQNTFDPSPERTYGNLDASVAGGRLHVLDALNARVVAKAGAAGVLVFDLRHLAACCGLWQWSDPAYWFHSKHPFSPALAGLVAYHMARLVVAAAGGSKKVAVLDLDNTLWGGVIGDDGIDGIALGGGPDGQAFQAFQAYLKALSARGVVLAVASKNDEAVVREAFERHPDMVLTMDDIAVFKANWRNKADNIREIAAALRLGLDSFVFIDDNPAERELVRRELPMVDVVDLPADPAGYVKAVDAMAFFETVAVSREDGARAEMYRANAARDAARSEVTDIGEYLRGLEMTADAGFADAVRLPRMTQLVNKSNQFHLTTTRYGEAEMTAFAADPDFSLRWYALADRFGDYGLISVVLLRIGETTAEIDTWAMSCRVLERGMEEFVVRDLQAVARSRGCRTLSGLYIPSRKNMLVADLYERLGFAPGAPRGDGAFGWDLPADASRDRYPLYIQKRTYHE